MRNKRGQTDRHADGQPDEQAAATASRWKRNVSDEPGKILCTAPLH